MISKEDIQNLANLARIEVAPDEVEKMTTEIDSILGYVGVIKDVAFDAERVVPNLRNVMRDDVPTNGPGEYTEKLLENAPQREGGYLKVKKIL